MKNCKKCNTEKPKQQFYASRRTKDGYNGSCKDCMKEQARQNYQSNKERHKESVKKWCSDNPEKWRLINANNEAKRRARKLNATPLWANSKLIEREYELAAWCTKVIGSPYQVDHIIPLQGKRVCGLHVEYNLQVIPKTDNCRKNNHFEIV